MIVLHISEDVSEITVYMLQKIPKKVEKKYDSFSELKSLEITVYFRLYIQYVMQLCKHENISCLKTVKTINFYSNVQR